MDLTYRLTRAQLVALAPCEEGIALFDRLSTGGVIESTSAKMLLEIVQQIPRDFAEWLGGLFVSGSGDGSGYGSGYGSGSGDGSGYGSGDGSGYGSGDGDGRG